MTCESRVPLRATWRAHRWVLALLLTVVGSRDVRAQRSATDSSWFNAGDWRTLGTFALGAAAISPLDTRLAQQLQRPSVHRSAPLSRTMSAFRAAGDPGAVIASMGVYALGRLSHRSAMADIGLHMSESVLVSGAVTGVLKGVFGRARPYTVHDSSASVFHPLSKTGGYTSFPSGHTTVAFAAASALSAEIMHRDFARKHRVLARALPVLLYGSASMVGVSRMYHDAHWASDVIMAAGIGVVSGEMFTRAQHRAVRSTVDRWLLPEH